MRRIKLDSDARSTRSWARKGWRSFSFAPPTGARFAKTSSWDVNCHLAQFRALGINVVSISVDEVPEIAKFAAAQKIEYPMLADPTGDINLSLGIRDEQYPVGSAQFGVPRPTLYIVDRSGMIRLRYMEPTYRTRPDLDAVLGEVSALRL